MRSLSLSATKTSDSRLSIRELTCLATMGALMFALKMAMAALPNIHPVAMLIVLTALQFSWRAFYAVGVYILLEGVLFGFGLWWISYLYIWPLLTVLTILLRKNEGRLFWASLTAFFGLVFGALCAIPYFFIGGPSMAFSYWISGIPFDLLHCVGNFAVTFALLPTLRSVLTRVCGRPAR